MFLYRSGKRSTSNYHKNIETVILHFNLLANAINDSSATLTLPRPVSIDGASIQLSTTSAATSKDSLLSKISIQSPVSTPATSTDAISTSTHNANAVTPHVPLFFPTPDDSPI